MNPFGRRILILVPHPDDEVVACATTIRHAQMQGAKIYALYLTHGCIAQETLWPWQRKKYDNYVSRRLSEAQAVANRLGIKTISFSQRPARHLRFHMSEVFAEIRQTIETQNIDQLWVPAYEGGNADHDTLNGLVSLFAEHINILEFAEYNFAGGLPHSQKFPIENGSETTIQLSALEQAEKLKLIRLYASERQNLSYVDVKQESFRPLALYDYSKPPHDGLLWYTRFHWVPFRHPRIDFTKPEEVSKAITSFSG